MKISDAITQADALRDNVIGTEVKASWLRTLDGQVADFAGITRPLPPEPEEAPEGEQAPETIPTWPFDAVWPEQDAELLMPAPHEQVYVFYLVAMIDYYNQESTLYQNDMAVFNAAMTEARAWWQRTHPAADYGRFKAW